MSESPRVEILEEDISFDKERGLRLEIGRRSALNIGIESTERIKKILDKSSDEEIFETGASRITFRRSRSFDGIDLDISALGGSPDRYFIECEVLSRVLQA